jgi:hypothetical protein
MTTINNIVNIYNICYGTTHHCTRKNYDFMFCSATFKMFEFYMAHISNLIIHTINVCIYVCRQFFLQTMYYLYVEQLHCNSIKIIAWTLV